MPHEKTPGTPDMDRGTPVRHFTTVHLHKIDSGDPFSSDGLVGLQTERLDSGLYMVGGGNRPDGRSIITDDVKPCAIASTGDSRTESVRYECATHGMRWETGIGEPLVTDCPGKPEAFTGFCVWHDRAQWNRIMRVMRSYRDRAWLPDA